MSEKNEAKVVARECRFAVSIPTKDYDGTDLHLVKENVHYEDGTTKSNVRFLRNYQRPFWVTSPGNQNHVSKKEWEDIDKLREYKCTQSALRNTVAKALNKGWSREGMRDLSSSPFLYGSDILSTACIKNDYQTRWPDKQTLFSVATLDIETDVIKGTKKVIMVTVAFKNKVFTAVQADFVKGIASPLEKIHAKTRQYLGEYVEKRGMEDEAVICESQYELIKAAFDKAHEWQPDFLAIWNMDYDIPEIVRNLEEEGINPADIFSDPALPPQFRFYKYKQGPKKKVTASGKVIPINPAAQWHTVFTPASFYVIDAMCAFKHIRTGRAEQPSYSLDAILNKELGIRKLKFKEADEYIGLAWHEFMQTNYKIEYIVYNRFDCISMLELDEKTKDLSLTLPLFSGVSDFCNFKSQPKRAVDNLHFYCLSKGKVIGATGSDMTDEADDETVSLEGWVVTLPAHLVADNGLCIIKEDSTLRTNIRLHVADLDISAAYPSTQICSNISKETTVREIVEIQGMNQQTARMQNINLSSGKTNALEYCQTMFNFPLLDDLERIYRESKVVDTTE